MEKLSEEESTTYFHSRPVPSQIAACTSYQSSPIESRDILCEKENQFANYADSGQAVPKPSFWCVPTTGYFDFITKLNL